MVRSVLFISLLGAASVAAQNYQYINLYKWMSNTTAAQKDATFAAISNMVATNPMAKGAVKATKGMPVDANSADMAVMGVFENMYPFWDFYRSKERQEANKANIDPIVDKKATFVFTAPNVKMDAPITGKLRHTCVYFWNANVTDAEVKAITEGFNGLTKKFDKLTNVAIGDNVYGGKTGIPRNGMAVVQDWATKADFEAFYNSTERATFAKTSLAPHAETLLCAAFPTDGAQATRLLRTV